jgi:hypothetical protein
MSMEVAKGFRRPGLKGHDVVEGCDDAQRLKCLNCIARREREWAVGREHLAQRDAAQTMRGCRGEAAALKL